MLRHHSSFLKRLFILLSVTMVVIVATSVSSSLAASVNADDRHKQNSEDPAQVPILGPAAPGMDPYGGLISLPSPNGGTGFFRVEKVGKRWMLVTPSGHSFWMFSVQNIGDYCFPRGGKYPGGKGQWAVQVRRRLKSWGFNTIGGYGAADVSFGKTEEMPFLFIFRPISNAIRNTGGYAHEAVKEIYENVPPSVYNGYRGILIDAFDPKYAAYAKSFFDSQYNLGWIPGGAKNPWLIGYSTEDGDEWFGLTVASAPDMDIIKPHPAWAVLVSMDPMRSPAAPNSYPVQKYTDLTNYSKQALRDFLESRYGKDLAALNNSWKSSYTAWDHDGGYGVGTGFLDEGGQHTWVASRRPAPTGDWNTLDAMTPAAKKDMDDFLEAFTEKLASVSVNAIRAKDPHHLVFSPDTMNQWGFVSRAPVLRAAAKWFDVLHVGYQEGPVFPDERLAAPSATYDITGKPMMYWIGFTANKDSSMSAFGDPYGVDHAPSQATRGEKYKSYISHLFNARGSNGDYFSLGVDFWGWEDQGNEKANWGLVSPKDNAYDGIESRIDVAKDRWGYPTGGETVDYGDFLGAVRAANLGVYERLLPPAR
jgi:hypothetical protein